MTKLLYIFIILPLISYGQSTKLGRPGINLYGELGYKNTLGVGLRYGVTGHFIQPTFSSKPQKIKKNNAGFQGVVLKYNRALNSNWNQLELGYQRIALIGWGLFTSSTITPDKYSLGLKPQLSFSIANFELFYNYNIQLLVSDMVNKHTFGLAYRILRIKPKSL